MKQAVTLDQLDALLAQDPEYLAAERALRPDLNLANDVVALRVQAGWSQAELAARVGTNQANISRLESALANPTVKFIKKVAAALGAELDVHLRKSEDMPGPDSMEAVIATLDVRALGTAGPAGATASWQTSPGQTISWTSVAQSSSNC